MNVKLLGLLVVVLMGSATPAHAVMGVGDITFDPTTYAEVAKMYSQMKQLWKTAQDQLKTLDEMQTAMIQAREGVEALQNMDLKKAAQDLIPGSGGGSNKIGDLRSRMSSFEGNVSGSVGYVGYQLQRIKDLEKLQALQDQSAKNLSKSSDKTSAEANSKITAQSTSVLATLAAAEAQRKKEEDLAAAQDLEVQKSMIGESHKIYNALGGD